MDNSILQSKDFTKLTVKYLGENKEFIRLDVTPRYIDDKTCYFGFALPLKYVRPKRNSEVELKAYTENGIYTTKVKLKNANMYGNDIILEVNTPTAWTYIQRRLGSRKKIKLPVTITFKDSFEINTITTDFSVGGLTFETNENLSAYASQICTLTIKFPDNILINFNDDILTITAKIIRTKEVTYGTNMYACNFIAVSSQVKETLKNFIMLSK